MFLIYGLFERIVFLMLTWVNIAGMIFRKSMKNIILKRQGKNLIKMHKQPFDLFE